METEPEPTLGVLFGSMLLSLGMFFGGGWLMVTNEGSALYYVGIALVLFGIVSGPASFWAFIKALFFGKA